MQDLVSIRGHGSTATVVKVTEKRREIPPNAAPRSLIDGVLKRATAVSGDIHKAVKLAGLSRATGYRIKDGTASLASVRELDEWLLSQERKQKIPTAGTDDERAAALAEWAALGEKLLDVDPGRFAATIDGVRDIVDAVEKMQGAIHKMFRATPDPKR